MRTGCFESSSGFDFSSLFFATDGSGGPFSNEPRLRKCAWAVVAVELVGDAYVLVGSITGFVCDGHNPNTVARAELRAFVELLRSVPDGCVWMLPLSSMCTTSCVVVLKRYEIRMGI